MGTATTGDLTHDPNAAGTAGQGDGTNYHPSTATTGDWTHDPNAAGTAGHGDGTNYHPSTATGDSTTGTNADGKWPTTTSTGAWDITGGWNPDATSITNTDSTNQ